MPARSAGQKGVIVRYAEQIHPQLPPMRLASRSGQLYVGPCPFCADGGEDRFLVWMAASGGRPAERYWCRVCNRRGLLRHLGREDGAPPTRLSTPERTPQRPRAAPDPAHIPFYRQLYEATARWAHRWLCDECHPDPLAYLHVRGLDEATICRFTLGVTLRDPDSLVDHLRATCPEAFPYAEEAGLLVTDEDGRLRTHWNLCGRIIFPYIADGQVVDLRTRTYGAGKGYRSLGHYEPRGATFPFGWDSITPGTTTVIVAEAEFKALAALQAYHAGDLAFPAIGQPGLTIFRPQWAQALRAKGVREVVLCYDSQPRPVTDGVPSLAPEEQWSLRHGAACAAAGLQVRVARLPLASGETKAEIDTFIPAYGVERFHQLTATAPLLRDYHRSISQSLLERHNLPVPDDGPTRRARPTRLTLQESQATYAITGDEPTSLSLDDARAQIAALAEAHATGGQGFLVLAHPPGVGKGHNATVGLKRWLAETPSGDDGCGFLVWTGPRRSQIHDQQGIDLILLSGRTPATCRKLPEAQVLAQKGYGVKEALCARRCPHVGHCAYLRQFGQEGDFFAATPLLRATGWWADAGVVVLDEFDPASLIDLVTLDICDLAAMGRAHAGHPAIATALRWVAQVVASTADRTLGGVLFLDELARQAQQDRADLDTTFAVALAELPPAEDRNLLVGLPNGATLADYQALPPGHTATLLQQIATERQHQRIGQRRTSRLEARGGRLELFLRVEHLIAQLSRPAQPKLILDATANPELLRAIFPQTPLRVEQPTIRSAPRVIQVIGRDWTKRSLRVGASDPTTRLERWADEVACHIRPGRPTLVVCTLAWEADLRAALVSRGHAEVIVAHYGALRGSNAYRGYDVILAQVYHPNPEQIIREGRALFADDAAPLDERMIVVSHQLRDATGAAWRVDVPTFADPRLAALLAQRREAEILQCALRGRPLDHPAAQITLLFGLPVPGLEPTIISEAPQGPASNGGRARAVQARLCAAAQQLLAGGARVIEVTQLARAAQVSGVTTRKHWTQIAARLHLRALRRRRAAAMPHGGVRSYERMVLVRRGRQVPPAPPAPDPATGTPEAAGAGGAAETPAMIDQARNRSLVPRLIHRPAAARRRRRLVFHRRRNDRAPPAPVAPAAAARARPPPPDP